MVFLRLRQCGLKLSPKKCSLFQEKVKYVGHIVSAGGIETDPAKIEKVINWPAPQSPEEVRQFLGFAGYYRRFIKDFAAIVRPLSKLMPSTTKKRKGKGAVSAAETRTWLWGDEQEEAFRRIKLLLSEPPVLGYADYDKPFELHVDASQKGLGAVLYQEQDGVKRAISFASRALNRSESHYPAHKLEFLALKWAVTEKFNDYLYGQRFTVLTDNNPLTYILSSAKVDATGHRWLAALSSYDFDIAYRPGKGNADADAMSRHPGLDQLTVETVQAVCHGIYSQPYVETIAMTEEALPTMDIGAELPHLTNAEIRQAQMNDPVLRLWSNAVRDKRKPPASSISKCQDHSTISRSFDKLRLVRGVLYRKVNINDKDRLQLVLPAKWIKKVISCLHDDVDILEEKEPFSSSG